MKNQRSISKLHQLQSQRKNKEYGGIHTLKDLEQIFSAIYNEITKWRKNLFDIPSGSSGKRFIEESTRLVSEWNNRSPLGNVSLKGMMIMPILLLQKPSKSSKAKDHKKSLESRLEQWISGDFDAIVWEGISIQKKAGCFCIYQNDICVKTVQ